MCTSDCETVTIVRRSVTQQHSLYRLLMWAGDTQYDHLHYLSYDDDDDSDEGDSDEDSDDDSDDDRRSRLVLCNSLHAASL